MSDESAVASGRSNDAMRLEHPVENGSLNESDNEEVVGNYS